MIVKLDRSAIETLRLRGISPAVFQSRISAIAAAFGKELVSRWLSKPITSVAAVAELSQRGAMLSELVGTEGLQRVCEEIRSSPETTLQSPEGQWFQLLVGASLLRRTAKVAFEKSILSSEPKDVVLEQHTAQIECKAFVQASAFQHLWRYQGEIFDAIHPVMPPGAWQLNLRFDWRDSETKDKAPAQIKKLAQEHRDHGWNCSWSSLEPSSHKGELVNSKSESDAMGVFGVGVALDGARFPFFLGAGHHSTTVINGPKLDDFARVYSALVEKRRQMVSGWSNVVALDSTELGGDIRAFRDRLVAALRSENISEVSAIVFVNRSVNQHFTEVNFELIQNPAAEIPCREELGRLLKGPLYWT